MAFLNCQSEVRIFGVKNENNPNFTLTKGRALYIDISRFSEPPVVFQSIFISVQSRLAADMVKYKRILSAESRKI